jgi:hypothetical protein
VSAATPARPDLVGSSLAVAGTSSSVSFAQGTGSAVGDGVGVGTAGEAGLGAAGETGGVPPLPVSDGCGVELAIAGALGAGPPHDAISATTVTMTGRRPRVRRPAGGDPALVEAPVELGRRFVTPPIIVLPAAAATWSAHGPGV